MVKDEYHSPYLARNRSRDAACDRDNEVKPQARPVYAGLDDLERRMNILRDAVRRIDMAIPLRIPAP
jgi:hypothetical protein